MIWLFKTILFSFSVCPLVMGEFPPACEVDISPGMNSCYPTTKCGVRDHSASNTFIIGGTHVQIGSWPWLASPSFMGAAMCGGTIVDNYWVVTAAHCFDGEFMRDPIDWTVAVGKHHKYCTDTTERHLQVEKIFRHPQYVMKTNENDIALMKLKDPIEYNCRVRPICLPTGLQNLTVGEKCWIAGFGMTLDHGDETILNEVMVPIINTTLCGSSDYYGHRVHPNIMMCAGYHEGQKDACNGDSGGPLICKRNGVWTLSGITSWGLGCGQPKRPGVYTTVGYYAEWLRETMEKHNVNIIG